MLKNKNMKKKFILSLGTIAVITTPVVAVVSCGGNKKIVDTKKESPVENKLNQIIGMIPGISESDKPSIVELAKELLLNGAGSVSEKSLIKLLDNLGVSNDIKDMVKNIFIKDGKIDNTILNMIFNEGLAKLADPENSETLDKLISGVYSILPSSIKEKLSKDFIKQILTGMTQDQFNDFATNSLHQSAAGILYPKLPILKQGLLLSTAGNWKDSIVGLESVWNMPLIGGFIKDALPHDVKLQSKWQLGNLIGNILASLKTLGNTTDLDDLTTAINSFFSKGLNSLSSDQKRDITNVIDWAHDYHQDEIFESDKETLKNGLKALFSNLNDVKGNSLNLNSIDKETSYDDIISAAKKIKAFDKGLTAKAGLAKTGLTGESLYKAIGNSAVMAKDTIGGGIPHKEGALKGLKKLFNDLTAQNGDELDLKSLDTTTKGVSTGFFGIGATDSWDVWPKFDALIAAAKNIQAYKNGVKQNVNIDGYLKNNGDWKGMLYHIKKLLHSYYSTNTLTMNDPLDTSSLDNKLTIREIIDAANALVDGKTLYKDKVIARGPQQINTSDLVDTYLEDNVKNFHFHINSMFVIDKYRKDIKTELSKLKTKAATTDTTANVPLTLTSLDNKETVKALSDEAFNILKTITTNGVFKTDSTHVTADADLKALIPTMPAQEYGYELTKEILTKNTKGDILGAKIAYQALTNIEPISKLVLEGIPTTEIDWNTLKSTLVNIANPILNQENLGFISVALPGVLDGLFKAVQEERK